MAKKYAKKTNSFVEKIRKSDKKTLRERKHRLNYGKKSNKKPTQLKNIGNQKRNKFKRKNYKVVDKL